MRPELLDLIRRTRIASGVPEIPSDPVVLEAVGQLLEISPRRQITETKRNAA